MHYILSLVGFECYSPVWFESELSKKEFKAAVKKTVSLIVKKAVEDLEPEFGPSYIDGHDILGCWNPETKKLLKDSMKKQGFHMIEPDYELSFEGECLYSKHNKKPPIFSKSDWKKILKHNEMVHNYVYKDEVKEEKEMKK